MEAPSTHPWWFLRRENERSLCCLSSLLPPLILYSSWTLSLLGDIALQFGWLCWANLNIKTVLQNSVSVTGHMCSICLRRQPYLGPASTWEDVAQGRRFPSFQKTLRNREIFWRPAGCVCGVAAAILWWASLLLWSPLSGPGIMEIFKAFVSHSWVISYLFLSNRTQSEECESRT